MLAVNNVIITVVVDVVVMLNVECLPRIQCIILITDYVLVA